MLLNRSKCVVCGKAGPERHHIKTRGSGGSDQPHNILLLCRPHHQEIHQQGIKRFTERYKGAHKAIKALGWQFCPVLLKWTNPLEDRPPEADPGA